MIGLSPSPGVATYWGNAAVMVLETAARSYMARHELRGSFAYATLLKVVALSMVQYEVILFVDMDVDVLPGSPELSYRLES